MTSLGRFMKKCNNHRAATSCRLLVSHSDLSADRTPKLELDQFSNICGFPGPVCTVPTSWRSWWRHHCNGTTCWKSFRSRNPTLSRSRNLRAVYQLARCHRGVSSFSGDQSMICWMSWNLILQCYGKLQIWIAVLWLGTLFEGEAVFMPAGFWTV